MLSPTLQGGKLRTLEENLALERPLPLPEQEVWRTFYEGQDPTGSVTVDDENIDFGACSRLRMSEYRTVTVTNKTDYKVTSLWHAPDGPDGSPAFTVFPDVCRL